MYGDQIWMMQLLSSTKNKIFQHLQRVQCGCSLIGIASFKIISLTMHATHDWNPLKVLNLDSTIISMQGAN